MIEKIINNEVDTKNQNVIDKFNISINKLDEYYKVKPDKNKKKK